MTTRTILFLKSLPPVLYSTEDFAQKVRDDDKFNGNPLVNMDAIDEAFDHFGNVLNPSNRSYFMTSNDYCLNVEGSFLSAHIPEIRSIIADKICTVEVLRYYLDRNEDITHIGLNCNAMGMDNTINVINTIKNDYSHLELMVGGVGTLYPHVQELIPKMNLCLGEGVNWIRKRLELPSLLPNDFQIPLIINNLSGFPLPIKTAYMVTQLGCPNSCNFCVTPNIHNYSPFAGSNKIIEFINNLYDKMGKDVFLYICDPNAFNPVHVWSRVFDYFYQNRRKYEYSIFILALSSLRTLSQFNFKRIQETPLKIFLLNYGIESDIRKYSKNVDNPNKIIDRLNELDIFTYHTFLLGLPFHTPELIQEEISTNLKYHSERFFVTAYKPIPGTPLYHQLYKQGRIMGRELPPELLFTFEYMPFRHPHLGFGFDILKHCFSAYYEIEKQEIDLYGNLVSKFLNLFEHTGSRKIKRLASIFMNLSDANFKTFQGRMPEDLVENYMIKTKNNEEKFRKLGIKHN